MSVTVTEPDSTDTEHEEANAPVVQPDGSLVVADASDGRTVAVYPAGGWRKAVAQEPPDRPYLEDAERWGTDREQLVQYARNAGHGILPTREVVALERLNRLIGNKKRIGPATLGRVRGVVLNACRDWHARQAAVVESLDMGPADPDLGPGGPDPREWVRVEEANRVLGEERTAHVRAAAETVALREARDDLTRRLGLLDDDLGRMRQERDDARRQLIEQGEAAEEQADALRSEVARLSGLLDEPPSPAAVVVRRLREFVAHLAAEDWSDRAGDWSWLQQRPRKIASSIEDLVLGERVDPAEVVVPELLGSASPHPIAEDPRRPQLDHYPEDALLLTYREVRQLVGLHLEQCGGADPARAMREGETPLRLAEVLNR